MQPKSHLLPHKVAKQGSRWGENPHGYRRFGVGRRPTEGAGMLHERVQIAGLRTWLADRARFRPGRVRGYRGRGGGVCPARAFRVVAVGLRRQPAEPCVCTPTGRLQHEPRSALRGRRRQASAVRLRDLGGDRQPPPPGAPPTSRAPDQSGHRRRQPRPIVVTRRSGRFRPAPRPPRRPAPARARWHWR